VQSITKKQILLEIANIVPISSRAGVSWTRNSVELVVLMQVIVYFLIGSYLMMNYLLLILMSF